MTRQLKTRQISEEEGEGVTVKLWFFSLTPLLPSSTTLLKSILLRLIPSETLEVEQQFGNHSISQSCSEENNCAFTQATGRAILTCHGPGIGCKP